MIDQKNRTCMLNISVYFVVVKHENDKSSSFNKEMEIVTHALKVKLNFFSAPVASCLFCFSLIINKVFDFTMRKKFKT